MIYVDKTKYPDGSLVTPPASLLKKKNYKEQDVKDALDKIFNGKCAYCESPYTHIMPVDIEHFRPKSIYPWLQFDWDNLLPSCIDCNRKRYQQIQIGTTTLAGKKDDFPLLNAVAPLNGAISTTFDLDEEEKVRQLLHPCIDNPEDHLEYDNKGYIFPKSNDKLERGKKSIQTYGLYRIELVKKRHEHLIRLFSCIERVQNLIFSIDKLIDIYIDNEDLQLILDKVIRKLEKNLEQDFKELKRYIQSKSMYTGMSKQYINAFLARIGITP